MPANVNLKTECTSEIEARKNWQWPAHRSFGVEAYKSEVCVLKGGLDILLKVDFKFFKISFDIRSSMNHSMTISAN